MRRMLSAAFLAIASLSSARQQPAPPTPSSPPDTDVWIARLARSGGALAVEAPQNITNARGYDNQPFFAPGGQHVYFTSNRGGTQTDIFAYDLRAGTTAQVTRTPESEYSPTVTPDGRHLSVIRVEADGTQRLWQFALDGGDARVLLPDVKPVGYHAWVDGRTVVLFVLGSPATLQVADLGTGRAEIVARDIGRSLQPIPAGAGLVSFVARAASADGAPRLTVSELNVTSRQIAPLVAAPDGSREADVAWTSDGILLVVKDDVLMRWKRGDPGWTRVADLGALGLRGVSRIAVSAGGDRIAFVTQPPAR